MTENIPIQPTGDGGVAPTGAVTGGPKPQLTDQQIMEKMGLKAESIEDAEAKVLGKSAVQPERTAEETEHQPESEPEGGEETPDAGDDLDVAWKALERDGWSKSDLKKLSRDRILELGAKRAKVQSDYDKAYSDLKSLKSKKSDGKPAEGTDSALSADDLLANFKAFEEHFLPEDAKVMRSVVEPLAKEITRLRALAEQFVTENGAREASRIRTDLSKQYGELKDDLAWDAVRTAARELVEESGDAEAALRAAVTRIYGPREQKKAGPVKNVATIPGRTVPPKPLSKDEREFLTFTNIIRGDKNKARQIWETGN